MYVWQLMITFQHKAMQNFRGRRSFEGEGMALGAVQQHQVMYQSIMIRF
jgi:hypothetical protein